MSARTSKWVKFASKFPNITTPLPHDRTRENLNALALALTIGTLDTPSRGGTIAGSSWGYTNSFTRGETWPLTNSANNPAARYWYQGSGITTKWIKAEYIYATVGAIVPTKISLFYSDDNAATWVPLQNEDGNHVCNITQAGGGLGYTATSTWGKS